MMFNHLMTDMQNPEFNNKSDMRGKWDWESLDKNNRAQVIVDNMKGWDYSKVDPTLNDFFYNLPVVEENVSITINGALIIINDEPYKVWINGMSKSPMIIGPQGKGAYTGLYGHSNEVSFGRIKYGPQLWVDTYYKDFDVIWEYITTPFPLALPIDPPE